MKPFNLTKLVTLTMLLVFLAVSTGKSSDLNTLVVFSGGFLYTLVLYFSLSQPPQFSKLLIALLILSIVNIIVTYTSFPILLLPKSIQSFFFYVIPSLVGALVTLMVLRTTWKLNLDKLYSIFVLILILAAALISPYIVTNVKYSSQFHGLMAIINSILWWIAFSLGLVFTQLLANSPSDNMANKHE